jgi:hypothetical protein
VDGLARPHYLPSAAKYKLKSAFQQRERLVKIVSVRRRPSTRRHVHIDQTKPPGRFLPRKKNRVRISSQPDVAHIPVCVWPDNCQRPLRIVGRNCRHRLPP